MNFRLRHITALSTVYIGKLEFVVVFVYVMYVVVVMVCMSSLSYFGVNRSSTIYRSFL